MIDLDELSRLNNAGDRYGHITPGVVAELIAEVRRLREESTRLDFMLENDAFTVRCNRDGSILQYQLMTQDEDENYHVLHDEHRFFNTERDAIDAARKAQP